MVNFTVNDKEGGKRLERVFFGRYPYIRRGAFYKVLRNRDVKVNGARTSDAGLILKEGDVVAAYIDAAPETGPVTIPVVFENDNIVLAEKPQGLLSEPDPSRPGEASLIELLRAQRSGNDPQAAEYELCHRLDRNTGGLIFVSRRPEFTAVVKEALNARYYRKIYTALVIGDALGILPADGSWVKFKAHLSKASGESRVFVSDSPSPGSRPIETWLRFCGYRGENGAAGGAAPAVPGSDAAAGATAALPADAAVATAVLPTAYAGTSLTISCVEAMLITGRTHQIRAHLAFLGYPVAGDGKYGRESENRLAGLRFQALWASRYEYDADWVKRASKSLISSASHILPKSDFTSDPAFR